MRQLAAGTRQAPAAAPAPSQRIAYKQTDSKYPKRGPTHRFLPHFLLALLPCVCCPTLLTASSGITQLCNTTSILALVG